MNSLRLDYSTTAISLREIKEIADQTRRLLVGSSTPIFDVVSATERLASQENMRWGRLNIVPHAVPDGEPFAKLLIKPNRKTLIIDPEIWADAKIGEPKSRFIVAHELGHITLHDHEVQPFSDEKATIF